VRRFLKELVKTGTYEVKGDTFKIDGNLLDTFAASFEAMKAAGVDVPVPSGHTLDPDKNRGWLRDMYRDGDSLFGVIELVGDDAIAMAGRADVSIFAENEFVDGKGSKYPWAITHVALTPVPVVPDLADFVELKAARDGGTVKAKVYRLSRDPKGPTMDWKKIAAAFGHDGELTDSNAEQVLLGLAEKLKTANATIAASRKTEPAPLHPQVITLSAENRRGKIQRSVERGRLSTKAAELLEAAFVGPDCKAIKFDMADGGPQNSVFDQVMAAIEANDPVPLGEAIKGGRVAALSREVPGNPPPSYDPKVTDEMRSMMPGFQATKS